LYCVYSVNFYLNQTLLYLVNNNERK